MKKPLRIDLRFLSPEQARQVLAVVRGVMKRKGYKTRLRRVYT